MDHILQNDPMWIKGLGEAYGLHRSCPTSFRTGGGTFGTSMIGAFRRGEKKVNISNLVPKFLRPDVFEFGGFDYSATEIVFVSRSGCRTKVDPTDDFRLRRSCSVAASATAAKNIKRPQRAVQGSLYSAVLGY